MFCIGTKMKNFNHKIDYEKLGDSLGISTELAKRFLTDGRIIGRLGEFIIEERGIGNRSISENTPYDNISSDGQRIEVRSLTNGISFASSKEVGYGRHVTESGFKEKLDSLDYYVCINFDNAEDLKFITVNKDDILKMEKNGLMRKNKSVSKKKFLKYIENKQ